MRLTLIAVVIASTALVGEAAAAEPIPTIPATAKRVTAELLHNAASAKGFYEQHHADGLPLAERWGARLTVDAVCKVKDRRHGSCGYTLDGYTDDHASTVVCRRRVYVSTTKKTRRVKARVQKSDCVMTPIPGAIPN